ncbi:tRNA (adenosine(37)-N6)-threonylcarbamoyltransferase complex transferase subunit TsaD [Gammaproteobacteria bacterium]|nr:tRNA (adenosine(37)-N6)-threonylcarbamoyltransferase complex transferase subunit TsaD [Gammaproteobacteria bacterium]
MEPLVLGIETSCDETALALYQSSGLVANVVYSQVQHQEFGGVVPELAAREHLEKLPYLFDQLLQESNTDVSTITHIAVTTGPGLIGALLVGYHFAQGLSLSLNIPLIPIHHLEAHIAAAFIGQDFDPDPFLTLLVSGGHTQILLTQGLGNYALIGQTLDDAAGEVFDKTAKIMGLGYPGGPIIEQKAKDATDTISLPRALKQRKDAMMSFSGIKTAAREHYKAHQDSPYICENIAQGLQVCIAEQLCRKINYAIKDTNVKKLVVSGGVSANQFIRSYLEKNVNATDFYFPELKYCTDNAAMVAYLGFLRRHDRNEVNIMARWPIDQLKPPRESNDST